MTWNEMNVPAAIIESDSEWASGFVFTWDLFASSLCIMWPLLWWCSLFDYGCLFFADSNNVSVHGALHRLQALRDWDRSHHKGSAQIQVGGRGKCVRVWESIKALCLSKKTGSVSAHCKSLADKKGSCVDQWMQSKNKNKEKRKGKCFQVQSAVARCYWH